MELMTTGDGLTVTVFGRPSMRRGRSPAIDGGGAVAKKSSALGKLAQQPIVTVELSKLFRPSIFD
jgi:hypothetical protein